jgi:hypothetical protein
MGISNRLKFVKVWLGLLLLGCALFSFGCAHDEDFSDDSSQHQWHHGDGGGGGGPYGQGHGGIYGQGQGGILDQSNAFGSQSRLPGQ